MAPEFYLYDVTTDYHWPTFQTNATKVIGGYDPVKQKGSGPFGFKSSTKLTDGQVNNGKY